jgi:hypothetical protein
LLQYRLAYEGTAIVFSIIVDDTRYVYIYDLKDRILQVLENAIVGLPLASDGTLYPLASTKQWRTSVTPSGAATPS